MSDSFDAFDGANVHVPVHDIQAPAIDGSNRVASARTVITITLANGVQPATENDSRFPRRKSQNHGDIIFKLQEIKECLDESIREIASPPGLAVDSDGGYGLINKNLVEIEKRINGLVNVTSTLSNQLVDLTKKVNTDEMRFISHYSEIDAQTRKLIQDSCASVVQDLEEKFEKLLLNPASWQTPQGYGRD